MQVEQIAVFLENKSGRLAEVTSVLADANVNIRALAVADASDFGVLRLIVSDTEKAEGALRERGFAIRKTDVVAIEVADRPGGLNRILDLLSKAGINVEYMYALARQVEGNAITIFRFDNMDDAVELLTANGISILDGSDVYSL